MSYRSVRIVLSLVALLLAFSLGADTGVAQSVGDSQGAGEFSAPDRTCTFASVIDSSGGIIRSADGAVSLTVPAGSVSDYSMVQLATELTDFGVAVDLSVSGLRDKTATSFDLPVSLQLHRPAPPVGSVGDLIVTQEADGQTTNIAADRNYVDDSLTIEGVNVGRISC